MPGLDLFPSSDHAANPYAILALPKRPPPSAPPLPHRTAAAVTNAWAMRAAALARLLEEAETEPGALWDRGLSGSEDIVRLALDYNMSDDPFFDANFRTREALVRLVARLGIVERKRRDLAVLLRWSERLDGTVDDFLADYIALEGRTLRWDALECACSAIVSRVGMLSSRKGRSNPRQLETERRYAVQHVGSQLNLIGWRFEQLCHARAFLTVAASGLRAARARHGAFLSHFQEDAGEALEEAAQRCAGAAERIDAALAFWAARIDRMEQDLLALQAKEALLSPVRRGRPG